MLPDYLIINTPVQDFLEDFFEKSQFSKVGVLVDDNTEALCYPLIKSQLPSDDVFRIKPGEVNKTLDTCQLIWDWMTTSGFDRHSLLINLGGGVIGDMGGFCASTFKRGIQFINIPTTLLSQVDASIGGKLGIDYGSYKNHIGVFKDPLRVVIDEIFLHTLPEKEILSGYAEVIKHSLIADREQWMELKEKHTSEIRWKSIIQHSIGIKSDIVIQDPLESGLRKVLNFGHTLGHAMESFFLESGHPLLHGEAIAAGMIMESWIASRLCNFPESDLNEILTYIIKTYGHHKIGKSNYKDILSRTLQDKKNVGKKVMAVLLKEISEPVEIELGEKDILEAIEFYDNIQENV